MKKPKNNVTAVDAFVQRISSIVAAIIAIGVLWKITQEISLHLTPWIILLVFFLILQGSTSDTGTAARYKKYLMILFAVSAFAIGAYQIIDYKNETQWNKKMEGLEKKLAGLKWISYEPIDTNPYNKDYGNKSKIKKELKLLRKAGFSGIITFSSDGILSIVPEVAMSEDVGFEGVVMGVIDITNEQELQNAISAKDKVDGYCVGHMFTDYPYGQSEVISALNRVRTATGRPVTTTLRPNGYIVYPQIIKFIDWFFPDIHSNWYTNASAQMAFEQFKRYVENVRELQKAYPDKPVLLKMISLPSSGVKSASENEQYKFFRKVVEYAESSMDFPERVYPSYFSGFDIMWKTRERGWPAGEQFVGFLNAAGELKRVTKENNELGLPVVSAIKWSRVTTVEQNKNRHNQ